MRKDYIDKFWIALGWDVNHETQTSPYEQDVKVEHAEKTSASRTRADYAFLSPNFRDVLFYVEAKKPHGELDTGDNYFQTIRYGWNSQTALAVLTDFEHLCVLDSRYKPDIDTALLQAVKKFHYTDYFDREKFKEIYYLFSREAVTNRSIDKFAATLAKRTGKAHQRTLFRSGHHGIDEVFLQELDAHREELAHSLKNSNPHLNGEELTEITQRALDRLVFMRFLEDKLIEPEPLVERLGDKGTAWQDFISTSHRLDGIYNGIIFKKHALLDSPALKVDERTFAGIRERLAHTNSIYDFNTIPIHILGSIYERFLGKVIVATEKGARVEEKPEVRKAGGVYYTPEYIVRYIVENTVGKIIAGKSPDEIAKLRFADISCGSGSFLLGVFDTLLRYHTTYYNNPANRQKGIRAGCAKDAAGGLQLTLKQRKAILVKNIYGVDLDPQAVEVAQLSLCLKLLEDETTSSARGYQLEFRETMLPSLDKNVVHGNSLIGWDVNPGLYGDKEERKLCPMDFAEKFSEVMQHGGFDAIVGNPPYRRELDYKHLMDQIARTNFGRKYRSARMDLWYYFVHRGLELLKPKGKLSYIVNAYWTAGTGAEKLISALRDEAHIDEIFSFGKLKVFSEVSGQHMVLLVTKESRKAPTRIKLVEPEREKTAERFVIGELGVKEFTKRPEQLFRANKIDLQPESGKLLTKLNKGTPLAKLGKVRQGIAENPAAINRKTNKKFGDLWRVGQGVFALRPDELEQLALPANEKKLLVPYFDLQDIGRYGIAATPSLTLIYSTRRTCPDINVFPKLRAHLEQFRPITDARRETLNEANSWWHLHWPRDESIWLSPKILSIQMASRPSFVPAPFPVYVPFSVNVFVPFEGTSEHLNYIVGLLNSKLMWKWYDHHAKRRGIGLEINGGVLGQTPIRTIDFADKEDRARHDRMVSLVQGMLTSKRQLKEARTDSDLNHYENKCSSLDRQIDKLVYELYGLTREEIALVEEAPPSGPIGRGLEELAA